MIISEVEFQWIRSEETQKKNQEQKGMWKKRSRIETTVAGLKLRPTTDLENIADTYITHIHTQRHSVVIEAATVKYK